MTQSALEKDSINISQTALDCKGTVIILKIIKCLCWFIKWEFEANLSFTEQDDFFGKANFTGTIL